MKVSLEQIELRYGDVTAVESLDLTIPDGESVVLLGQSGCGKTSTMRCVAGLEVPDAGRITIGDRVIFDATARVNVPSYKRNVGMVFQSYAVWPHKTVLQNVTYPLTVKRTPKAQARSKAMEVLELVGLAHLADRGASNLSGGQMQRVALARSMAMQPSVLLLDEPLSNLDARLRDDLRVELRRIQLEEGLTTLYVTHDQQEALALADQVAIMQHGRITQLAAPAELYQRPKTASIAKFLGVANIFPVVATTHQGRVVLREAGIEVVAESGVTAESSGPLSVCFRPEDVHVTAVSDTSPDHNVWPGQVRVAVFQGHSVRYQVELSPEVTIDAICDVHKHGVHQLGDSVQVHVPARGVQLLPDDITLPEVASDPDAGAPSKTALPARASLRRKGRAA